MGKFKNILKILKNNYEKIYSYSVSRNYDTELKDALTGFLSSLKEKKVVLKFCAFY